MGDAASSSRPDVSERGVLVVGAGPTGLLAAILLARCGIPVRIIDTNPSAAKESRAFAVHARTLEILLSLGLADEFMGRGVLATGARIYVDGKPAAALDLDIVARRDTPYPTILFLPQSDVEEILNEELVRLGVAVERGVTATELAQDEGGVTVGVEGESAGHIRAAYVIGADGAHSMVRKALGLTFEGAAYPRTFLLADCKVDGPLEAGPVTLFLNGLDVAGYFPLRGRDYGRILALEPPTEADPSMASQGSSPVSLERVEECLRAAAGPAFSLRDPIWTSRYRIHHRGADRYGRGRAFIAGDAAHIHSPVGGQGMNTGLQDVTNLVWKIALALKGAPPALLDSYDQERRPVGRKVTQFADRGFELVTTKASWVSALRDAAAPLFGAVMARSDALRARAFHFVSQLGIRYHAGPAVQDEGPLSWKGGPEPGRRAPDAEVARGRDVFDLIGGYRFHLLALSRTALDEGQVGEAAAALEGLRAGLGLELRTHLVAHSSFGRGDNFVQAETGAVFGAYGIDHATPQGLYLIRPDGHVAWRSRGFDWAGCRAFVAGRFSGG